MPEKKTTTKKAPVAKKPVAKKTAASTTAPKPAAVVHAQEAPKGAPARQTGKYVFATGRRKTAIAVVRLFQSDTGHMVNRKAFAVYFNQPHMQAMVNEPLRLTGKEGQVSIVVNVSGGGLKAQAEATRHGLSRALIELEPELKTILKQNGFLTRDDRKKERKKPGLKRARRAPQWAKR